MLRRSLQPLALLLAYAPAAPSLAEPLRPAPAAQTNASERPGDDEAAEVELARAEAERKRRRGERSGLAELTELVDDDPSDAHSRSLLAQFQRDLGLWDKARANAERAAADSKGLGTQVQALAARTLARILLDLGEAEAAQRALEGAAPAVDPRVDARDSWLLGQAAAMLGKRERARELWAGASADASADWQRRLAGARCARALGDLTGASRRLVEAEEAAETADGREPDVLAEIASLYFEADGELDHPEARGRVPGEVYRKALALHPTHQATLLGLFELGRFNWNRQSKPAHEFLDALLAGASADVDDGKLDDARAKVEMLRKLGVRRRELRTLEASLAWIEHRREECEAILAELRTVDPVDARPEREIARHLSELYRFAEAAPIAKGATERDPADYVAWMELGRALANTGDEAGGLEALRKSEELAAGRQNAWRHNTILVLDRIRSRFVRESGAGQLSYAWSPAAADVLREYWMPFYASAREELAKRYGFTPGPTTIEVFERFQDFSVRSTGFEGFPALGVCFGPVVTSVAPHSELRGNFSWAETSYHEFTHVIHLGLSHNRCPRWITEGLATWEEENKDPSWTRNMRRELLDAYANDDLIGVRDLNRAFRSQRILFGYYMSGQLCRMWIETRGFAPMIRLLEAFDRGLDLDQALRTVFDTTPEQLDREFREYVARTIEPLRIEPRWSAAATVKRKLALSPSVPSDPAQAGAWRDGWCSVAWGYYQQGKRVDAEQALRKLAQAGELPPRAKFLQAEIALDRKDVEQARKLYDEGFAAGGEDYRARMAAGKLALTAGRLEEAEAHFLAAEKAFPGYAEEGFSAERHLADLYQQQGRVDDRFRALERALAWGSDDQPTRVEIARWHVAAGRHADAEPWFRRANEIDPFRRAPHEEWGKCLSRLGRHEEALREFRVALLVPPELDLDGQEPTTDAKKAELLGLQALELAELRRDEEARDAASKALELADDEPNARSALERLESRRP